MLFLRSLYWGCQTKYSLLTNWTTLSETKCDFGFPRFFVPMLAHSALPRLDSRGSAASADLALGRHTSGALVTTAVSGGDTLVTPGTLSQLTLCELWSKVVWGSGQRAGEWTTGDGICRRLVLSNRWRVHAAASSEWHQQKPSHENQTQSEGERVLSAQTQTLPQLSTSSKKQQQ